MNQLRIVFRYIILFCFSTFISQSILAQNTKTNTMQTTKTTATQYISDTTITTKVKAALLADKDLNSLKISVTTNKGAVTLTGSVPNSLQKHKVVSITKHITGVKSVIDRLTIKK